jgi:chaperonin GroES
MRQQSNHKMEMDPARIGLIGNTILVRVIADENKTRGGIIIPLDTKNRAKRGIVVSRGPKAPEEAAVGFEAVMHSYAVEQARMTWEGSEYAIYNGEDVMAVEKVAS